MALLLKMIWAVGREKRENMMPATSPKPSRPTSDSTVTVMFAAMTFVEAMMLWLMPPHRGVTPLELHFRYGLFLSAAISMAGVAVAIRFGGSLDNLPKFLLDTREPPDAVQTVASETSAGRTLH